MKFLSIAILGSMTAMSAFGQGGGKSAGINGEGIGVANRTPFMDALGFTPLGKAAVTRATPAGTRFLQLNSNGTETLLDAAAFRTATGTSPLLTSGPVRSDASGTSSVIDGSITLPKLAQGGATAGQAIVWSGTQWAPAAVASTSFSVVEGVPNNATGSNGEYRLNYLSGVVYKKVAGVWVANPVNEPNQLLFVTSLPLPGQGVNGDMAVIYSGGVGSQITGLAQKAGGVWTQIAAAAQAEKRPSNNGIIEMVDHFISGANLTGTNGTATIGSLGWLFSQSVGTTGGAKPVGNPLAPGIGVVQLQGGATSGNTVNLTFGNGNSGNTGPFVINDLKKLGKLRMAWVFKFDTVGDMHIGICSPSSTVAVPARFVGIRALNGTTNFEYVATNGTPAVVNSAVPVDTTWHRFEIEWDAATNEWIMSLDGIPSRVPKTLDDSHSVTIGMWVTTKATPYQSLFIDSFRFYGEIP